MWNYGDFLSLILVNLIAKELQNMRTEWKRDDKALVKRKLGNMNSVLYKSTQNFLNEQDSVQHPRQHFTG